MSKDVYVVRHGDGWGVRTAGAGRVAKSFETKVPAFEYGRRRGWRPHRRGAGG